MDQDVWTESVTDMAINKDFLMGYGAGKASGGGGGNPNYTQVITGTVANPWGDLDVPTLASALLNGGASGVIEIDASSLGFGTLKQPIFRFYAGSDIYTFGVIISLDDSSTLANRMNWGGVMGGLNGAASYQNGTVSDISPYASMIPTTLTIYWHPMPES